MKNLFGSKVVSTKKLSRETLTPLFIDRMKGITESELIGMLYSPYEAIIDFARLCDGEIHVGQNLACGKAMLDSRYEKKVGNLERSKGGGIT